MAEYLSRQQLNAAADFHAHAPGVAEAPPAARTVVDRTFELPSWLYQATIALYLGFMAVMMVGFGNPVLVLPIAVIVFTIIAGFALPAIWQGLAPDSGQQPKSAARFAHEGIVTAFGHSSANGAIVQVLILPALIFVWGVAVVIIAALV